MSKGHITLAEIIQDYGSYEEYLEEQRRCGLANIEAFINEEGNNNFSLVNKEAKTPALDRRPAKKYGWMLKLRGQQA